MQENRDVLDSSRIKEDSLRRNFTLFARFSDRRTTVKSLFFMFFALLCASVACAAGLEGSLASLARAQSEPNTYFVGTNDGRVFISRDGGITWDSTRILFSALPLTSAKRRNRFESLSYQGVRNISGGPSPAQVLAFSPIKGFQNSYELNVSYRIISALNGWLVRPLEAFPEPSPYVASLRRPKNSDLRITALDVEPYNADIAVAGGTFGVWRTMDRGKSWRPVHTSPGAINCFARHPRAASRLFACTDRGVFFSDDQGDSWTELEIPEFSDGARALAFHPETATLIVSTNNATYQSNDGGSTFNKIATLAFDRIVMDVRGNTFGISRGTLYRRDARDFTSYGNGTFIQVELPFEGAVASIAQTEDGPNNIFVATNRDLFSSLDRGKNWQVVQIGGLDTEVQAVAPATSKLRGLVLTRNHLQGFYDPAGTFRGNALKRFLESHENEPTLTDVIRAALKRSALDNIENQLERANIASILPRVSANFSYRTSELNGEEYPSFNLGERLGYNEGNFSWFQFYLTANWQLSEAVYSRNASPNSGLVKRAKAEALALTNTLSSAYQERQALKFAEFIGEGDARAKIWRDLRIEALEAKIECLSGLSLKRANTGDL